MGTIVIEIAEHKTDFMLSIIDNGHGLEQEQINRLFDAFYINKDAGVGIGLSSVKNILEEHGAPVKWRASWGKVPLLKSFSIISKKNKSIHYIPKKKKSPKVTHHPIS